MLGIGRVLIWEVARDGRHDCLAVSERPWSLVLDEALLPEKTDGKWPACDPAAWPLLKAYGTLMCRLCYLIKNAFYG
jgi:hypothetical protein